VQQITADIRQAAIALCDRYVPDLLAALIRAVVIHRVPSSIRLIISDLIGDLKMFMPTQFVHWLSRSLADLPRKSKNGLVEIVTVQQHEQFYKVLCE
jgi:hypothetical protein